MGSGVKILMLTRYGRLGASSRVRAYQYIGALEAAGFEVTIRPLLDDGYLRRRYARDEINVTAVGWAYARRVGTMLRSRRYDLLYIEKELFQWIPGPIERLLLSGTRYVLDYDDAIFHTYDQHRFGVVRSILGSKIAGLMQRAQLVIVGNEYLAQYAATAGARRIAVVPTAVDLTRYEERKWPDRAPFTVGWIGSPSTTRYLNLVAPALADACGDGGRVLLVGAREIALPGARVTRVPWAEETEVDHIRTFDLGIMPLPDEPWARGKCGYKLIQYMACGIPVVASPVGVNAQIVAPGVNGFLPTTLEQWRDALLTLRARADLRRSMGEAGRRTVEDGYSSAVVGPTLVNLLESAVA